MKLVVGYVNTDEGKAALQWASDQARRQGDEVIVVHSIRGGGSIEAEQEEVLAYRKDLDGIERRLAEAGVSHKTRRLIRGWSPAEDLIQVVAEEGADMIVIGLRRRSRAGKFLLGSDAVEILHDADCPVVTVKASYLAKTGQV